MVVCYNLIIALRLNNLLYNIGGLIMDDKVDRAETSSVGSIRIADEVVSIIEKQMRDKKAEVDSLENAIKEIRNNT